jgi:hypothetical protein
MEYQVEYPRVNLAGMDFAAGNPTKKLTFTDGNIFAGNAAEQFRPQDKRSLPGGCL